MTHEHSSDTKKENSRQQKQKGPNQPSPLLPSPENSKTETQSTAYRIGQREEPREAWLKRQLNEHASDWANVFLGMAIVYFAWSSGQETRLIMEAAQKNADAAFSFAESAKQIRNDIQNSEAAFQRMATSSEGSVMASSDIARTDQRAWIGVDGYHKPMIEVGKHFVVKIQFKNTGNTPAVGVRSSVVIDPVRRGEMPDFTKLPPPVSRGVIPPSGDFEATINATEKSPKGLSAVGLEAIQSGKQIVYVHGMIWYFDIFGVDHWTKFCNKFLPDRQEFEICAVHNDVDKNRRTKTERERQ